MDEVDGMSAGDRGGVGALNALIKKSKVCHDVLARAIAMHGMYESSFVFPQDSTNQDSEPYIKH